VWSYELGVKSDWLENRLRINGAVFHNDYKDYQIKKQTFHPVYGMLVNSYNAGGADISGIELEVVGRPTPSLTLNGAVTYLDTEYKDFEQVDRWGVWHDVSGQPLTYVPDLSFTLGANYVMPIGNAGFLTFGANLSWRDAASTSAVPDPLLIIDDYTLVNALVRFETEDGRWSLEAYGKNIFEEEYYRTFMGRNDRTLGQPGDPRTYGIKLIYRYF
jgi:iron complex outermembrane receptor protein